MKDNRSSVVKGGRERGLILPSVLIVLAFASAIVMLMISVQDIAIERSRRFNEAAQAAAYAKGGELSVVVALRRDGQDAPRTDNLTEPWASIGETNTPIENGTFSLAVHDEQALFNVNNLAIGNIGAVQVMRDILSALRLPAAADSIAAFLKATGPVRNLHDLGQAGLADETIATLAQMVTALPTPTAVNVNTADEALLAILLRNRMAARLLVSRRDKTGLLTPDDVAAARVLLNVDLGYTSGYFRVDTTVTIGDTAQSLSTLLQRTIKDGAVTVTPISRSHRKTAPSPAPLN